MIDKTFNKCVNALETLAAKFGISYEQINVLIFVILWPAVTLGLIIAYLTKWGENDNRSR